MNKPRFLPWRREVAKDREAMQAQTALTAEREKEAEAMIRKSYTLAHRLAEHRRQNNFSARVHEVFAEEIRKGKHP